MALNAKNVPSSGGKKGPEQEPMDPGTYPARVVQVIDLGVQPQRPYKGEEKAPCHEIMMTYEFLDEFCLDEDGEEMEDKPRWLSETFPFRNLEADLATSTKRYKALDPDMHYDGDFTELVHTPCMVTVVQNAGKGKNAGKVYTNIASVSTMRAKEARNAADLVNEPKVFVLDEPDLTIFKSLPQWLQDKIKGNLEYKGSALEEALEGAEDDDQEGDKPAPKPKPRKSVKKPVEAPEPDEEDEEEEDEADGEGEPW